MLQDSLGTVEGDNVCRKAPSRKRRALRMFHMQRGLQQHHEELSMRR